MVEPALEELEPHVEALVAGYNHPRNTLLLGHSTDLTADDVRAHYRGLIERGDRPFLLFADDQLAGDGDLRGIDHGSAEFAFLIADPDTQGRGLGTRFATMIHALAFQRLGLERIYASVIPENVASRRVFEKLGYVEDQSEAARTYGDEGDVTLSIAHAAFIERHSADIAELDIRVR